MAVVEYYYTSISPYAYLGHRAFEAVVLTRGCSVAYKPVDLARVWAESGATPLAERAPSRKRYRFIELQRWADIRGLPITLQPAHFPADPSLADQCVIALLEAKHDPSGFMERIFKAVWVDDENISDPGVLERHLDASGFDADTILHDAQSEETMAHRQRNSEDAIAADALGVPTYVLNGEPFWGQDRIEQLDHALTTGRTAFSAPAA